ncbi:uncharacterized protein LOC134190135 isoform X2 [Corticium candelabrum]|uniref:uncharacterized protein LOC134190135 isoform X2 n=1 Tax=Corticium candelabrum TaxID=121492 RepID=UPI002E2569CC|nr:uncharacterized protein LOC134190135 isoform X2 [Corticium candelabrum]
MMLLRLWIVLIPLAMRTRTSLQASNGVKGDQDKYVYANDEIDQTDSRGDDHDEGGFANQLDTPRVSMDNHSNHSMPMNMMQMYFHFLGNEPLLFKGWTLDTTSAVVGACFAFFVVAALYEGLKFLRDWLMTRTREVLKAKDGDDASMPLLGNSIQINGKKYKRRFCIWSRLQRDIL